MAAQASSLHVCMDLDNSNSDWLKNIVNLGSQADNSNSVSPTAELISYTNPPQPHLERRLRPPQDHPLKCPRCDSTHTKFCYYNNYSLSQPRYFCKTCRRYWTKGGSLRNVPVGGGCRKTKKKSSSALVQQPQPVSVYRHSAQLTNLDYFSCDHIGMDIQDGGFDAGLGFSLLSYEREAEAKPMLSLEWPDHGCGGDLFAGYGSGFNGLWAGMVNGCGNGSSSSAAM